MPFDEEALEHLIDDKIKYATRIYLSSFNKLFKINPYLVVSDLETNEFILKYEAHELLEKIKERKVMLYREKKDVF